MRLLLPTTAILVAAAAHCRSTVSRFTNQAPAVNGPPCCFADNCLAWSLDRDGHTVHSTCWDKLDQRGHWHEVNASLDLDLCVGNVDGTLVAASGGEFHASCRDCQIEGTALVCSCVTEGARLSTSTLDLNSFIMDYSGVLRCFNNYDLVGGTRNAN